MLTLPGLMRYLARARGAVGILLQQEVSVVMEVADDGHAHALLFEPFDDVGDGLGGIVVVDGDADHFGAGAGQGGDLLDGAGDVRGIGVGHGLHHNRCIAAHADATDRGGKGFSTVNFCHIGTFILAGYGNEDRPPEEPWG